MTPALLIDIVVACALFVALIAGWRLGGIASVLSTVGVFAGLLLGAGLAPIAMTVTDVVALRILIAAGLVLLFVSIGNLVGGMLGTSLHVSFRSKLVMRLDNLLGAAFHGVAVLAVLWLISVPLATGLGGAVAKGIGGSQSMAAINRVVPHELQRWPSKIAALLNDSGLPPLFSPFEKPQAPEVAAPRVKVDNVALVEQLRPSVVHVVADATHCRRRLLGSGVVLEPDYVVTNAHVVAGSEKVRLDTTVGTTAAHVVYYNPQLDIAVLHSPGLGLPALQWAEHQADSGEDTIVMGFPQSGPFEAAPARVRSVLTISGPDIYSGSRVERQAYTVRGSIREGNSGGPMVNEHGEVLGIVFGASLDESDTGYVLTADEVRRHVGRLSDWQADVGTQECVAL